ncbi:MAG: hypothetical protein IKS83_05415 [Victivallales bacterium]|nr:hypothetical protein [Victivallales bacterium]
MYQRFLMIAMLVGYGWPLWGLVKGGLDSLACQDKSHRVVRILYHVLVMMLLAVCIYCCGPKLCAMLGTCFATSFWANVLFATGLFGIFLTLDLVMMRYAWHGMNPRRVGFAVAWWVVFSFGTVLGVYPIPQKVPPGVRSLSGQFDQSLLVVAYPGGRTSSAEGKGADKVVDSDGDLVEWFWLHRFEGSFQGRRLIVHTCPCGGLYIHLGDKAFYVNVCSMMYNWTPALFQMHLADGEIWISTEREYFVYNIVKDTLQQAKPARLESILSNSATASPASSASTPAP